jgi:hypothetical protein
MRIVYFVQDTRGGEINIGVARMRRLEKQVQQLQAGNPSPLKLLGVIRAGNANRLVRELRTTFSAAHVGGDWFGPVAELEAYVRSRSKLP